jgi:hypothetical protein
LMQKNRSQRRRRKSTLTRRMRRGRFPDNDAKPFNRGNNLSDNSLAATFTGAAKHLLWRFAPALYRRLQPDSEREFSIAIAVGDSPLALEWPASIPNPVLTRRHVTDVPAEFVADPFMCRDGANWYLFFEVVNHLSHRGEIGLAVSPDGMTWKYQRIVLAEPFHLSYPHVFEWNGSYYMIPEGSAGGAIRLYRAAKFPYQWERIGNLIEGPRFADASILRHGDTWWLFTDAGADPTHPVLRLYFSDDLLGPWREHPLSPLVRDPHFSRPAGRIVVVDGTPVRFTQDIYPVYGSSVSAFAITRLTPTEYEERRLGDRPMLAAGAAWWNRHGMHHVDAHLRDDGSWIACVDGLGTAPVSFVGGEIARPEGVEQRAR